MPAVHDDQPVPPDGIDAWVTDALARLSALADVRRVGIALVEGGGRRLLFTASDRERDRGLDWCHIDGFAAVPLNDVIRSAEPVAGRLAELDGRYATYVSAQQGTGFTDVANLPFMVDGRAAGGCVLYYGRPQPFDERQIGRLRELADELGRALGETLRSAPRPAAPEQEDRAGALVAETDVPPDTAAVAEARRFLHRTLADWEVDEEITAQAVLCLSELVTNAVIHTTGGCHVQVELRDGVLTSRVHDNGTVVTSGLVVSHEPVQAHGHGLRVVNALSSQWGRNTGHDGAEVWFALEVS